MENLSNGKILSKTSNEDFSSDRLLIADCKIAEKLSREMLKDICNNDLQSRSISIILHPLEKGFGKIYPVEKMIYRDFIHWIGGHEVVFEDSIAKLDKRNLEERIRTMPNNKNINGRNLGEGWDNN